MLKADLRQDRNRFGLKVTLLPGFLLLAVSLLIVSRAGTLPIMLIGAVTGSLGWGAVFPGLQAMGIQAVHRQNRRAASNTIICGQDMGFFLSPLVGGIVYAVSDYLTMYQAGIAPCVITAIILTSSGRLLSAGKWVLSLQMPHTWRMKIQKAYKSVFVHAW
jgi:MFS family permease